MGTEDISARFVDLDLWETADALRALHEGQLAAVSALGPALPAMAKAVDEAAVRLRRGGRLVYVGAGTSARIGVQDGAELLPTFNWPADNVAFVIAGGEGALLRAVENAEDSGSDGEKQIAALAVGPNDVVLGVAASGNTPFTIAAVVEARRLGAMTIGISNNAAATLLGVSEYPILIDTGAEPVAGSTRLKAGTAQKVALNLFSTMVMVRMGRVYRGMMVNMRPTNAKLRLRAAHMVTVIADCSEAEAAAALEAADGDLKLAALIACGIDGEAARALLHKHDGNLRLAMAETTRR